MYPIWTNANWMAYDTSTLEHGVRLDVHKISKNLCDSRSNSSSSRMPNPIQFSSCHYIVYYCSAVNCLPFSIIDGVNSCADACEIVAHAMLCVVLSLSLAHSLRLSLSTLLPFWRNVTVTLFFLISVGFVEIQRWIVESRNVATKFIFYTYIHWRIHIEFNVSNDAWICAHRFVLK